MHHGDRPEEEKHRIEGEDFLGCYDSPVIAQCFALYRYTPITVSYYFYIARCADMSLYAGTCLDLALREAKHNTGKGAKYTRSRRPVRIVYSEEYETLGDARRREAEVKKWKKVQKESLIRT